MRNRQEYEKRLKSFVNESVSKVFYYTISVDDDEVPYQIRDKPFHSLDFGLELHMTSGRILGLIWGKQFATYGLDLLEESLVKEFNPESDHVVWDISLDAHWKPVLGKAITDVQVYWSWRADLPPELANKEYIAEDDIPEALRQHYPQDIEIEFETGAVYCVGVYKYFAGSGSWASAVDELTIFFDDDVAKQYQVGRFAT